MAGSRVNDCVNAAVDALKGDTTLRTLLGGTSKVYSFVPEETAAPYVLVTGGTESAWAEAFNAFDGRQVDVRVLVVSAYRGTYEVDALMSQVLTRLTTATTWTGITGYAAHGFIVNDAPLTEVVNGIVYFSRVATVRVWVN